MTHGNPAARSVAVQPSCAEEAAYGASCPKEQIDFAPFDRWQLIDLVTEVRKSLKLTSNDISVLRALVSFLPVPKAERSRELVTPQSLTIVFASNKALSHRAGGIDDRVLRHAFRRLQAAGLIRRRDSATGKRFPIRIRGKIVDAFGLDIAPAFAMAPELIEAVEQQRVETETRNAIRAEIFSVRRATLENARGISTEIFEWFSGMTKVLRRNLGLADLQQMLIEAKKIALECKQSKEPVQSASDPTPTTELGNSDSPQTRNLAHCDANAFPARYNQYTGSDGIIYRHNESKKRKYNKAYNANAVSIRRCWAHCQEIAAFFPTVPTNPQHMMRVLYDFARMMKIRTEQMAAAAKVMTWTQIAESLDFLAKHALRIGCPSAYFQRMVQDVQQGSHPHWLSSD